MPYRLVCLHTRTMMLCADLALLEAAVAIAIPVQELHSSEEPTPEEHRLQPVKIEERIIPDRCSPARPCQRGLLHYYKCIEGECGSAPSTPRMTDSPFADLILFAERQAALEIGARVLPLATAALGKQEHAGTMPSIDQRRGDGAEEGTAQYSSMPPALMGVAGPQVKQQPASGIPLQEGFIDQPVGPGHQAATTIADSASDHSAAPDEQDEGVDGVPTCEVQRKSAVQKIAVMSSLSPRQSQCVQAGLGRSTHACTEREADSIKTHQSGRLLAPPQSSCQGALTGAAAAQHQSVCETEALGSEVFPLDACAPLELGKASSSGHSSNAATAADGEHDDSMQTPKRSRPVETLPCVPPYPAPLQDREGSGASSQLPEQAHPPAVTPQPAGSERASRPVLTITWSATSHLEGDVPAQTATGGPESPLASMEGVLYEAAEQCDHQIDIPGDRIDNIEEGRRAAPSVVSASMQGSASLRESREDSEKSANGECVTQPDQASSSGSLQVHLDARPQSTSRAHEEPQAQPPQLAQEVLNSVQLSDALTCASQQLLGAMHHLHTSSGTTEADQSRSRDPTVLTVATAVPEVWLNAPFYAIGKHIGEEVMQVYEALAH